MRSYSAHQRVLFLLVLILTTGFLHAVPSVKVKLNQLATLPCKWKCSGLVRWSMFHNPVEVLAQCNQTSCRSRDGFEISHDEYLQGNLALVIRSVDYSKRTMYTCDCDGKDICYLRLSIQAVMWSLQIKPGEDLSLDLLVPEPVEVIYNSKDSDSKSSGQICRVAEASLHCNDEYKQRVSYDHSNLMLGKAQTSDSGLYIIQDMKNNEVIRMYSVSVEDDRSYSLTQKDCPMEWLIGTIVGLSLIIVIVLGILIWQLQKHKRNKKREEEAPIPSFICLSQSEQRRWKRSYSDTEIDEQWAETEQENRRQRARTGRRVKSYPSSLEGRGNVHMPLLAEIQ